MDNNEDSDGNDAPDRLHIQQLKSIQSGKRLFQRVGRVTRSRPVQPLSAELLIYSVTLLRCELKRLLRKVTHRERAGRTLDHTDSRRIVLPPRLFYDGLLRRLMSPAAYKRYIVPHVADMHEEYFACLAKGDERGARWAVIRGHLYVIPSWVWSLIGQLLARVLGKRI